MTANHELTAEVNICLHVPVALRTRDLYAGRTQLPIGVLTKNVSF